MSKTTFSDFLGLLINVKIRPFLPRPDRNRKLIACIGDSLTFGAGVRFTRGIDSYPARLQKYLGKSYQVLNYGLSWRTLLSSGDIPYCKERFYQESKNVKAGCYIIMIGSNDAKPRNWDEDKFSFEYQRFVKSYLGLSNRPLVILMTPAFVFPNRHGEVPYGVSVDILRDRVCSIVKETGKENGCPVFDMFRFTGGHRNWFIHDGAHLNAAGNRAVAKRLFKYLTKDSNRGI